MTTTTKCPICTADVPISEGRGRPHVFCGEVCRRTAEFGIRRLARRIDATEVELRSALAGLTKYSMPFHDERERAYRVAVLRRWLEEDTAKLRALLGGEEGKSKSAAESRESDAAAAGRRT
jgi:hypothetical protein